MSQRCSNRRHLPSDVCSRRKHKLNSGLWIILAFQASWCSRVSGRGHGVNVGVDTTLPQTTTSPSTTTAATTDLNQADRAIPLRDSDDGALSPKSTSTFVTPTTSLTSTATAPRASTTMECADVVQHNPQCESMCIVLFRTICGLTSDKWGNKCYADESSTAGKALCRQVTAHAQSDTASALMALGAAETPCDENIFATLGCSERSVVCRMQISSRGTTTIRDECPLLCGVCDTTTTRPTAGVMTHSHLTTPLATPQTVTLSPRPAITSTTAPTTATHAHAQGIADGNDVLLPMWVYVVVCLVVVAAVGGGAYIGTKSSNKRGASGGAAPASKRNRRVRRRSNLWNSSAGAGASDTDDSDAEDAVFDLGVADFKGGIATHAHLQRNVAFAMPMRPAAAAGYIDISGSSGSASEWTSDTLPSDSTHSAGTRIHTTTLPLGAASLAFDSSILDTYLDESTLAELSGTDLQSVFWQTGLEPGSASAPNTLPMNMPISSDASHLDQRMLERHQEVLKMEEERRVHDQHQVFWQTGLEPGSASAQQPQQSRQRWKEQSSSNESLQQSLQRYQSSSNGSINSLQRWKEECIQALQREEVGGGLLNSTPTASTVVPQNATPFTSTDAGHRQPVAQRQYTSKQATAAAPAAPPVHAVGTAESEQSSHERRGASRTARRNAPSHAHQAIQQERPQDTTSMADGVSGSSRGNPYTQASQAMRAAANAAAAVAAASPSGNGGQAMMMAAAADLMSKLVEIGGAHAAVTSSHDTADITRQCRNFSQTLTVSNTNTNTLLAAAAHSKAAADTGAAGTSAQRLGGASALQSHARVTLPSPVGGNRDWTARTAAKNRSKSKGKSGADPAQPGGLNRAIKTGDGWSTWVLECGAKERNVAIREFELSVEDVVDLKKTSRRMKLLFAQRRYLAGLRKREAEEAAASEGRPPPPAAQLGSPQQALSSEDTAA